MKNNKTSELPLFVLTFLVLVLTLNKNVNVLSKHKPEIMEQEKTGESFKHKIK